MTGLTAAGMAVIFGAMGYIAMQGQDSVMTQDETPEFVVVLGAQVQGDEPSLTLKSGWIKRSNSCRSTRTGP